MSKGRPTRRSQSHKRSVEGVNAEALARALHAGQTRKHDNVTPYIQHPEDVAGIVRRYGGAPHLVDAGWLHDVLEDTPICRPTLGLLVADLRTYDAVVAVTNVYVHDHPFFRDWGRARRKQAEGARLGAASRDARFLKMADILSNLSMHGGLTASLGTAFARVYLGEVRALIEALCSEGGVPPGLVLAVQQAHARELAAIK